MSLMPAQTLESYVPQMKKKGRLQVGMDADIAVFDPETVAPVGTYAEPYHPAVGVMYVLVAGVSVADGGDIVLDAAPGEPVRR
jgi:N-acyl-D-glutamate deacylase